MKRNIAMSHHTILKGTHRSILSWFPRFHINRKQISNTCTFYSDANYDFGDIDQLDINKLFGLSYGLHHNNSARFGWRWNIEKQMVEILAYVYVDGVRITEGAADLHIGYVHPGIQYDYTIKVVDGYYEFTLNSPLYPTPKVVKIKCSDRLTWWGYKLYPYFGGNKKAPHTVHIDLERIS